MQSNNQGILSVDLLHPLGNPPAFFHRLQHSIRAATRMRAAVAFWTVGPNEVSNELANRLAMSDSFLCVDLHLPTSVDQLVTLDAHIRAVDASGQHLFLHLHKIEGQTEAWGSNKHLPENLLHTKALLFDFDDGTAEVWIGSHNWTRRALVGINIEASVVTTISRDCSLYVQTSQMLEQIRASCEPFDASLADYYRWLQEAQGTVPVIILEGQQADSIANSELKLFGTSALDFPQFRQVGRQIFLLILDAETRRQYLYRADIATASDSHADIERLASALYGQKQRYVYRPGRRRPRLELPLRSRDEYPKDARYCATISVQERLPESIRIIDPPAGKRWTTKEKEMLARFDYSPLFSEASYEYGEALSEVLRKVIIRRPAPPSVVLRRARSPEDWAVDLEGPLFQRKIIEGIGQE